MLKDKSITAYQDGPLPLDVQGEYRFNEDSFDVSEAAAAALLAGLPESRRACRRMLMIISCSMRRSLWTAGSTS